MANADGRKCTDCGKNEMYEHDDKEKTFLVCPHCNPNCILKDSTTKNAKWDEKWSTGLFGSCNDCKCLIILNIDRDYICDSCGVFICSSCVSFVTDNDSNISDDEFEKKTLCGNCN